MIRPVLREASQFMRSADEGVDENKKNLETAVNQILDNKKEMFILMKEYCLDA